MSEQQNIPPVSVEEPAEGTQYWGNEPLDSLNGGLLPTLEEEPPRLSVQKDTLASAERQPLSQPPTAETGVMPIVAVNPEGDYDNDRQDATRTTAELQVVVAASSGR